MNTTKQITFYSVMMLLIGIIAVRLGIISSTTISVVAFTLLLSGGAFFYKFFASGKKLAVFNATAIFLGGLFLFITDHFPLIEMSDIIYPAGFFIISGASLMMFLEDTKSRVALYAAGFFFIVPVIYLALSRSLNLAIVYISLVDLLSSLWEPFAWGLGIILFIWILNRFKR